MESLDKLTNLRILDLSCNKIRVVNGLFGLLKLEKLVLAHNKIVNIQNLKQVFIICYFRNWILYKVGGENYNLKLLDLSDNKIQDYKEILVLNK